jgi:hypothetical protein
VLRTKRILSVCMKIRGRGWLEERERAVRAETSVMSMRTTLELNFPLPTRFTNQVLKRLGSLVAASPSYPQKETPAICPIQRSKAYLA